MGFSWHDCPRDHRAFIERATAALREELGTNHVGTYLHGSLAHGSYHPPKSDIDLLVVAERGLVSVEREAFAQLCVVLQEQSPSVSGLELSVVQRRYLRQFTHPCPFELNFGEKHVKAVREGQMDFVADRTDPDLAAYCYAVRQRGIVLSGPPIDDVFGPVPWAAFVDSILGDFAWIIAGNHILESPFYSVLNACRVLQVLSGPTDAIMPSKEEGGAWAFENIPIRFRPIVTTALEAYRAAEPVGAAQRPTGGKEWDAEALRAFRDWAAREAERVRPRFAA